MSNNPNNKQQQQNAQAKSQQVQQASKDAAQEAATQASEQTTSTTSPTDSPVASEAQQAQESQAPGAVDLGTNVAVSQSQTPAVDNSKELAAQRSAAFAAGAATQQQSKARRVTLPSMPVVRQEPVKGFGTEKPLSDQPLADWVKEVDHINVTALYEKLNYLDVNLGPGKFTSAEQAAMFMRDTYQVIVNAVERETDEREFNALWTLILRMVTETPNGGFAAHRLWRGKPFWPLSEAKFTHFESLWNLIDATVRHGKGYKTFVNDRKVMQGFSGPAQGRLGIFYRMMG